MPSIYSVYPSQSSGGGGITSINGDTTAAQVITGGTGISVATASGTTTITNTGTTGPGSSTNNDIPVFNGTSGKVLKDSGVSLLSPSTDNIFLNAGNGSASGTDNFAALSGALASVTDGSNLIAIGVNALHSAQSEANDIDGHVAIGYHALSAYLNDTGAQFGGGDGMIAIGAGAFQSLVTSDGSIAIGRNAGANYTTGGDFYNVHIGSYAGNGNTSGNHNTSVGYNALSNASGTYTATDNVAIGYFAMGSLSATTNNLSNTVIGTAAGSFANEYNRSTLIGFSADTNSPSLTNVIALGYQAVGTQSNSAFIGNNSLVGLFYSGYEDRTQIATPSNPGSGHNRLYFKSDNNLYSLDSSGTETQISGGSFGANTALSNLASVAINTTLLPASDGSADLGSTTGPLRFGSVWVKPDSGPGTGFIGADGNNTWYFNASGVTQFYNAGAIVLQFSSGQMELMTNLFELTDDAQRWGVAADNSTFGRPHAMYVSSYLGIGNAAATIPANTAINFQDGHLKSTATAPPSPVAQTGAGTGASATVSNATDTAGTVNLTLGSAAFATGAQVVVTFQNPYNVAPIVVFSPANADAGLGDSLYAPYVTSTTTDFTINFATAALGTAAPSWNYTVIETA